MSALHSPGLYETRLPANVGRRGRYVYVWSDFWVSRIRRDVDLARQIEGSKAPAVVPSGVVVLCGEAAAAPPGLILLPDKLSRMAMGRDRFELAGAIVNSAVILHACTFAEGTATLVHVGTIQVPQFEADCLVLRGEGWSVAVAPILGEPGG